jgi:hypothetical protein
VTVKLGESNFSEEAQKAIEEMSVKKVLDLDK